MSSTETFSPHVYIQTKIFSQESYTIPVIGVNDLVGTTLATDTLTPLTSGIRCLNSSSRGSVCSPIHVVSDSFCAKGKPGRSMTPLSVPVVQVSSSHHTSSCGIARTTMQSRHRIHRQVGAASICRPRPLSDGPMGWTYTPVTSRPLQSFESFLPIQHYAHPNTSALSLLLRVCGLSQEQIVVATPGAEHAMTIETKRRKFSWLRRPAKKVKKFFKRSQG